MLVVDSALHRQYIETARITGFGIAEGLRIPL